ncbi:MAG: galactokinase [Micromonosporaceae bacterium]
METTTPPLARRFTEFTRVAPEGVWAAPGRVNLIGEHTDYNDGFVLPLALPRRATVAAARRDDGTVVMRSLQRDGEVVTVPVADLRPGELNGWAAYPAGVVWALADAGHPVGGADLVFDSDVPSGAGLSSSAALECATAVALNDMYGLDLGRRELARLAQRAENDFVGMPCGILDQAASMLCEPAHALFLDTRGLAVEQVPLDLESAGLVLLVIQTREPHAHVDGEYAERRASCEAAARRLGVPALRDVGTADLPEALERLDDEVTRRRVRHVVTENARVLDTVELLRAGQVAEIGPLLTASHESLRDDYEVSTAALDLAVATALANGGYGARMTGGGFGGCAIALLDAGAVDVVSDAVRKAFAEAGHAEPATFPAVASPPARRLKSGA